MVVPALTAVGICVDCGHCKINAAVVISEAFAALAVCTGIIRSQFLQMSW